MTKDERIEKLEEAQQMINEAVELIYEAFEGKNERSRLSSYICGYLTGWAEGTNPHDSTAIPRLIEEVEAMEEDEELCRFCDESGDELTECSECGNLFCTNCGDANLELCEVCIYALNPSKEVAE